MSEKISFWKKRTTSEKAMIGAILLLIIMIILSWGRIQKGVQKGIEPYKNTNSK